MLDNDFKAAQGSTVRKVIGRQRRKKQKCAQSKVIEKNLCNANSSKNIVQQQKIHPPPG